MGNESADLDSLTSSICFAYLQSYAHPPKAPFEPIWIPVVNIPAADLSLRPEYAPTLVHAGINPQDLITKDDIIYRSEMVHESQYILVDHNSLQGGGGMNLAKCQIAGVVDHHDDEEEIPDKRVFVRIIKPAGSCTSLVVNYLRDTLNDLPQSDFVGQADASTSLCKAEAAKLALASILIDTSNMTATDKVTEHDRRAVEFLLSLLEGFDQKSFYEEIKHAKEDIGGLPVRSILRKDYKQWEERGMKLGISSVVKPLSFLVDKASEEDPTFSLKKDAFLYIAKQYIKEQELDIFSVMTAFTADDGKFHRELFVWVMYRRSLAALESFEKSANAELGLEVLPDPSLSAALGVDEWRKAWKQAEIQHSRKRVAPLLRKAMM